MLYPNMAVNSIGHLTFGGADVTELADKYGTPLYLLDENRIREKCRVYSTAMRESFGENSAALYAGKALCFKGIYGIIHDEGLCADVVSGGEIYTALAGGFPAEKLYFHGNFKTDAEIEYAVDSGVGCFVIDNDEELERLDKIAGRKGIRQKVLLRVTPGIDPHTFEAVNTGKVDSKFGVSIETGQAAELFEKVLTMKNIALEGLHCHVGSQLFDNKPMLDTADIMLDFMAELKNRFGYNTETLNLGGGYGVRYIESDPAEADIAEFIRQTAECIKIGCAQRGLEMPDVLLEPGRSIVADAGMTIYSVGSVKTITGYRSYVIVDGGMTDNPRYALYKSQYTVLNASRPEAEADFLCTVAGRCCESGDLIQEDVLLARPERGELLAVCVTGAYNYAMSSNYNRLGRPPIVMISDGQDRLVVRRETFEDIAACDL